MYFKRVLSILPKPSLEETLDKHVHVWSDRHCPISTFFVTDYSREISQVQIVTLAC